MQRRKGRYFRSLREWINYGGNRSVVNRPSIHISGSVRGMRRQFWGYECDVVRVGSWIYKAN